MIVARPLDQINPVHLVVQADTVPTAKALAEFLPRSPVPRNVITRLTLTISRSLRLAATPFACR